MKTIHTVKKNCRLVALTMGLVLSSQSGLAADVVFGVAKSVKGKVTLTHAGSTTALTDNTKLYVGDVIKTDADGRVHIKSGSNNVFVAKSTELTLKSEQPKGNDKPIPAVDISYGKLRAMAGGKKTGKYKIMIQTPNAVAGVRGSVGDVIVKSGADGEKKDAVFTTVDGSTKDSIEIGKSPADMKPLPEGALSYVPEGKNPTPALELTNTQFSSMRTSFDGGRVGIPTESGEIQEMTLSPPVGTQFNQYSSPAPMMTPDGKPNPPVGFELDDKGKYIPREPTREVMVDNSTGSVTPVVEVPPSIEIQAQVSQFENPKYIKVLADKMGQEYRGQQLKMEFIQAKMIEKDEKKADEIRSEIAKTELGRLKAETQVTTMETQALEKEIIPKMEAERKEAERKGDSQKLEVLTQKLDLAANTLEKQKTETEFLKVQESLVKSTSESTQANAAQERKTVAVEAVQQKMAELKEKLDAHNEKILEKAQETTRLQVASVGQEFGKIMGMEKGQGPSNAFIQNSDGRGFPVDMGRIGSAGDFKASVGQAIFMATGPMPPPSVYVEMAKNMTASNGGTGAPGGNQTGGPNGPPSAQNALGFMGPTFGGSFPGGMPGGMMPPGMMPPGMMPPGMMPPGMMPPGGFPGDGRYPATGFGGPSGPGGPGTPFDPAMIANLCASDPMMCMGGHPPGAGPNGPWPPGYGPGGGYGNGGGDYCAQHPSDPGCSYHPPPGACASDPTMPGCGPAGGGGCLPGDPGCYGPPPPCPPGTPGCTAGGPPPCPPENPVCNNACPCCLNPNQPGCGSAGNNNYTGGTTVVNIRIH